MKNFKMKTLLSLGLLMLAVTITCGSALAGGVVAGGVALMSKIPMPSGSMFTLFNPAQLTWNGKEVMSLGEAIVEMAFNDTELEATHTIVENIVAKQQIAYLGRIDKIVKRDAGCGSGETTKTITASEKFWDPCKMKIWLSQCADDLEESFFVWALKKGIDRKDLTNGEFADFVSDLMTDAAKKDIKRIAWFGDIDAGNVTGSPAGNITDGVDIADYNMCIDGFWKQLETIAAADADRHEAIAKNVEATFALQAFNSTDTTNKVAHGIFQAMTDNMDTRLADQSGLMFLVTKSLADQYKRELKNYASIPESFMMVIGGIKVLTFDGIPVIPQNDWDRIIRADFSTGVAYYRPHRAVLTIKENLLIGVDGKSELTKWKQFYLPKEETTNFKGGFKMDVKVSEDYLVQVAW